MKESRYLLVLHVSCCSCEASTSDDHNFLIRSPFFTFLDSMEIQLSKISIQTPLEGSGCLSQTEMAVRSSKVGCPGKTA